MRVWWFWVFLLALPLVGCGALINSDVQPIVILSMPLGATIQVDGETRKTPIEIHLERNRNYNVSFHMDGFNPVDRQIESVPDNIPVWLNCLFALCIPEIWESGGPTHYRLLPEKLDAHLDPIGWTPR